MTDEQFFKITDKIFRFFEWLEDEGPILAGVIFSIALIFFGIWAAITDL